MMTTSLVARRFFERLRQIETRERGHVHVQEHDVRLKLGRPCDVPSASSRVCTV
jgi:hypothetical protein